MTEIEHIIKYREINTVFQSIHDLRDNSVVGFEVLSRGPEGRYHAPQNLFAAAKKERRLVEMEMLCFKQALKFIQTFQEAFYNNKLFFNFHAITIIHRQKEIEKNLSYLTDAVIELSEVGTRFSKRDRLINTLESLREEGIQIALDDVGGGTKDFFHMCEIPFDYLKIDRSLIRGITRYKNGSAAYYKKVLLFITDLAKQLNARVIAEGVETEMQLAGVKRAGINLAQGFYFSKPMSAEFLRKSTQLVNQK